MSLKCCLSKYCLLHRDVVLLRRSIFSIFVSVNVLAYVCLIYLIYFAIIIFIFISTNHIISLIQTNLFVGHVCQKFSLRVLLSFCLIFCQFQPGIAYKSVAYKKKYVIKQVFCTETTSVSLFWGRMFSNWIKTLL